jgi:hypothetical protein
MSYSKSLILVTGGKSGKGNLGFSKGLSNFFFSSGLSAAASLGEMYFGKIYVQLMCLVGL